MTKIHPKLEVSDKLFQGELELVVIYPDYSSYSGHYESETYVFLDKDQIMLLRDHLNGILEKMP